ncbi:hypothetical protein [Vibrio agarivorans]|uniref:HPr family phosphocarrier protein n=1 Tax=Vibrio agarivorans TaxID=153622 RepID=A0ABT7Y7P3_9VIBR|nr:hypothetical protein [Vibrio agarivorans]MDN2484020.1 hypothetical protein [Vibrio agarivorans]
MVDVNTKGVNDAFERLSAAALQNADSEGNCIVDTNDLSTLLMAFTLSKQKNVNTYSSGEGVSHIVTQTLTDFNAKVE